MKSTLFILPCILILFSCTKTKKESTVTQTEKIIKKELSVAETIAYKNGIEYWKDVEQIDFTFNVDRGESHYERSWSWKPKTDDVTMTSGKNSISYNRNKMDSITMKTDGNFINDSYWLLAPYKLVWDKGTTLSKTKKEMAPISKDSLNMITITYGDEGGYTPGDAYDFFYDDKFMVKEWVFRKGNTPQPSMMTTFEDYETFNGLKLAKMHQDSTGGFKLYFSNISVKK